MSFLSFRPASSAAFDSRSSRACQATSLLTVLELIRRKLKGCNGVRRSGDLENEILDEARDESGVDASRYDDNDDLPPDSGNASSSTTPHISSANELIPGDSRI